MCKVLIFGCVAAVILMTAAYGVPLNKTQLLPAEREARLEASITDLELLKKIDNVSGDFLLSEDSFECNHATLACFLKELNILKQDVEGEDKQLVINIEKNLEDFMVSNLLQDRDFSNPTCKKCEANEKKKFAEFHEEMTRFLQSMKKESV
uniref:Interleukin n=1 Tax=Serinus canaria TaxID=9135 RepID=A0A8C9MG08_SERCA